jgi:hypothetical protein
MFPPERGEQSNHGKTDDEGEQNDQSELVSTFVGSDSVNDCTGCGHDPDYCKDESGPPNYLVSRTLCLVSFHMLMFSRQSCT